MRRARLLMFLVSLLWRAMPASAQEPMPVLETDSQTYSNVVVTSKTATHIFIKHSLGMAGIKVRSLEPALQKELGYELEPAANRRRGSIFTREIMREGSHDPAQMSTPEYANFPLRPALPGELAEPCGGAGKALAKARYCACRCGAGC